MERTHALSADRAWLPRSVRQSGKLVTGAVWAGAGIVIAGAVLAAPLTLLLWKGLAVAGVGLTISGRRAGNRAQRRQLQKMTRGEIELADLGAHAEGELVVVRGTIDVEEPLRGVLVDAEGVYRRMTFARGGKWVHEAATDFSLIDEHGHRIRIFAAGARWLVPERELVSYPAAKFRGGEVSSKVQHLVKDAESIDAFEQVLTAGTAVQIVGYKTASADVEGEVVDYRQPPQRATLRSGPDLPLVIARLDDLKDGDI